MELTAKDARLIYEIANLRMEAAGELLHRVIATWLEHHGAAALTQARAEKASRDEQEVRSIAAKHSRRLGRPPGGR